MKNNNNKNNCKKKIILHPKNTKKQNKVMLSKFNKVIN